LPDDELDDLFRKSLNNSETPFDPEAWNAMEKKLDAKDRRRAFYFRTTIAVFLVFLISLSVVFRNNIFRTHVPTRGDATKGMSSAAYDKTANENNYTAENSSSAEKHESNDVKSGSHINSFEHANDKPKAAHENNSIAENIFSAEKYKSNYINPSGARTDFSGQANDNSAADAGDNAGTNHRPAINDRGRGDIKSSGVHYRTAKIRNGLKPRSVENINKNNGVGKEINSPDNKSNPASELENGYDKGNHSPNALYTSHQGGDTLNASEVQGNLSPGSLAIFNNSNAVENGQENRGLASDSLQEKNNHNSNKDVATTNADSEKTIPGASAAIVRSNATEDSTGMPADTVKSVHTKEEPVKKDSSHRKSPVKRWSMAFLLNPEFSTTKDFNFYKLGFTAGIIGEYYFSQRLSLLAGGIYSKKIYTAEGYDYTPEQNYWPHHITPTSVRATCNVIEIPLNIRYRFLKKETYNVFVSSGLSSYIMLNEHYNYQYNVDAPGLITSSQVINKNRYFLKVYNLSAGFEKFVGKSWSVQAEPYIQLPFCGLGEGKIKLISTGMYFSVKHYFR
jgi:hypothetical protein